MIITNSLMRAWSECPKKGLLLEQGYRPAESRIGDATIFGQLFHEAVETYLTGPLMPAPEFPADFDLREELVRAFDFYRPHLQRLTDEFEVLAVEQTFRVPIVSPRTVRAYTLPDLDFAGKVDGLLREKSSGNLWVYELKTRQVNYEGDTFEFHASVQASGYAYAMTRVRHEPVVGALYHIVRRNPPKPPLILKSGALSKDKRYYNNTTVAMIRAELERLHLDEAEYAELIGQAAEAEQTNPFFREVRVYQTPEDLYSFEAWLFDVAREFARRDMNRINPFQCPSCAFARLCYLKDESAYLRCETNGLRELDGAVIVQDRRSLTAAKLHTILPRSGEAA